MQHFLHARGLSEGHKTGTQFARSWKELAKRCRRTFFLDSQPVKLSELFGTGRVTINILPDDVLLIIFDFYRADIMNYVGPTCAWHRLVQVCRRWRHVVFASPARLGLHIVCTERTPVRELMDIWPPLPIIIRYWLHSTLASEYPIPSAITALEHRNRVHQIQLSHVTRPLLDILATGMQEPFPALTMLELWSDDEMAPVLPDTFLGGSAPRLQIISLEGIAFPALPKLLFSTVNLVSLLLDKIPPDTTGYISPQEMATGLSRLACLKFLRIDFLPPAFPSNVHQNPRQQTRAILPSLTWFEFQGVNEYLEDLISRIEAPLLDNIDIKFFDQITFDIPQLLQFITHSEKLNFPNEARMNFHSDFVRITLSPRRDTVGNFTLQVLCTVPLWQVLSMVQICDQAIPLLSSVQCLQICGGEHEDSLREWQDNIEIAQWLELFYPFTAVASLHVTENLGPFTASALCEVTGRMAAEVLPALHNLFLEGPEPSEFWEGDIWQFTAARRHCSLPVVVCRYKRDWEHNLEWAGHLEVDD